jgi:hypothetical protein
MDLNELLGETGLADLSWLEDPETYVPKDKDINKKDDLAIEWGIGSGIDIGTQPEPTTIQDEMDVHSDEQVTRYARNLMTQGVMPKQIVHSLIEKFGKNMISESIPALKALFANAGVIGCVAVDSKDCHSCKDIMKVASKSPFKRHIKFAFMNEGCADCAFLGKDANRPFCASLSLPVITKQDDISKKQAKSILAELVSMDELTEEEAEQIVSQDVTPYQMIKLAFFKIGENQKVAEEEKYAEEPVASDDFELKSGMDIDVQSYAGVAPNSILGDVALGLGEVNLTESHEGEIEVDASGYVEPEFEGGDEVELDAEKDRKDLDVDIRSDFTI